jgi:integrase
VLPWTARTFSIRLQTLRQRMISFLEAHNRPEVARWLTGWPHNCLRHSFASYHLAIREDAGATAYQMGHTNPGTLYRNTPGLSAGQGPTAGGRYKSRLLDIFASY